LPPRRVSAATLRIPLRNQSGELECFRKRKRPAEHPRVEFGADEVLALDRAPEDGAV
jgi:hypothetical protein